MQDFEGNPLEPGDRVVFYSARKKNTLRATVQEFIAGEMVAVLVDGDPFPVNVSMKQLKKSLHKDSDHATVRSAKEGENTNMAVATKKTTTKELRLKAKELGVEDWQSLERGDLLRAIKRVQVSNGSKPKARRTAADKAAQKERIEQRAAQRATPAKKVAKTVKKAAKRAPDQTVTDPVTDASSVENPFRKGSSRWRMAEELLKGDKRKNMVKRLKRQIDLHPYTKKVGDLDVDFELDKRLMLTAQAMVNDHGFVIERDGRGLEGTIKVTKPAAKRSKRK